jgi:NAD(P)-dependent dehydrogenase (short-subunit alcohol dehydrogenase family)
MNYLITGASRGIGYDTALELAADASKQILVVSRNKAALETLTATAAKRYGHQNIAYLPVDLQDLNATELHDWVAGFGPLTGLVNNAGLLINKPFEELQEEDWQATFEINFFSVVRILQSLKPLLQNAHVINISSMGGFQGSAKFPGLVAYSAAKAALANLTECLAEEWKEEGIAVNCLALGAVQTEMLATAFPGFKAPVSSAEMGSFVAWFLQRGHTFFNGKVLPVSVSTP